MNCCNPTPTGRGVLRGRRAKAIASTLAILTAALATVPAAAQMRPLVFGTSDDPREAIQTVWWSRDRTLQIMAGPSLIGPQWRMAGGAVYSFVTRSFTGRMSGTVRMGVLGRYEADMDELYDVLRLIEFVRYNPPVASSAHLRIGTLNRIQLGSGHLVSFFNSNVAWDERTIGFEFADQTPVLQLRVFGDDLLLSGVAGSRLSLTPFRRADDLRMRSLEVGLSYITDFATWKRDVRRLAAYNVDVGLTAIRSGDLFFSPFASFAWYEKLGSGIGLGADLESLQFLDLARFRFRIALFYNGQQFIPGYVGSFYAVHNPRARILDSDAYLADRDQLVAVGVAIEDALGGNDLVSEFRLLFFDRFELWYHFRRHYGTLPLSEYHLKLFLRVIDRLRLDIGVDRGGLSGFFSLFRELNDQTALVFDVHYHLGGSFWTFLGSRYTFTREKVGEDGTQYFHVQRRFEPLAGLRWTF